MVFGKMIQMRMNSLVIAELLAILLCLCVASPSGADVVTLEQAVPGQFTLLTALSARLTRTFVSSTGIDTNPCTVAQPCATFAAAYAAVAPNGIVAALDPGHYGPLNITGPVTIDGNGWAAITVPSTGGEGIAIVAGASDEVILTGLTIDGAGGGSIGVSYVSGASLTVENCAVRNVGNTGLMLSAGTTPMTLFVSNSSFDDNGILGVNIEAGSAAVTATFDRTEFNNNSNTGLAMVGADDTDAPMSVAVSNSVISNNNSGVTVTSLSDPSGINVTLTRSQVVGNRSLGIWVNGNSPATLWLGQSTVAGNASGYTVGGDPTFAIINSYGDNFITDTNNTGSLTPVSKQ
jgi:hypothetical protein